MSHTQGHKIVHDRARGARHRPHTYHLIRVQARLQRFLGERRIYVQIAIQEQITDYGDAFARDVLQQVMDRVRGKGRVHKMPL